MLIKSVLKDKIENDVKVIENKTEVDKTETKDK